MALHLILSSLAWTIIRTVLHLDYYVTTPVIAASNKTASLVICKTKSEYFDPRRGQLVANQSSPSRVTPQSQSERTHKKLTHAVANWWPISPRPAVLHHNLSPKEPTRSCIVYTIRCFFPRPRVVGPYLRHWVLTCIALTTDAVDLCWA